MPAAGRGGDEGGAETQGQRHPGRRAGIAGWLCPTGRRPRLLGGENPGWEASLTQFRQE